jgi:hypothetical protein
MVSDRSRAPGKIQGLQRLWRDEDKSTLVYVMYDVFTYLPAAAAHALPAGGLYGVYCTGMYMDNMDKLSPHGVPTKQDMMGAAPRASRARGFSK